jgi:hypothetical protein
MSDEPVGISQAGLDIRWFQPRISLKNGFRGITSCQHAKDMFDRQPASTDNRFATENFGIHRDSLEKNVFIHDQPRLCFYHSLGKQRRKPVKSEKIALVHRDIPYFHESGSTFNPLSCPTFPNGHPFSFLHPMETGENRKGKAPPTPTRWGPIEMGEGRRGLRHKGQVE